MKTGIGRCRNQADGVTPGALAIVTLATTNGRQPRQTTTPLSSRAQPDHCYVSEAAHPSLLEHSRPGAFLGHPDAPFISPVAGGSAAMMGPNTSVQTAIVWTIHSLASASVSKEGPAAFGL